MASRSVVRDTVVMTRRSASRSVAAMSPGRHGFSTTTSRVHPPARTLGTSCAMPTASASVRSLEASTASVSRPNP